MIITSYYVAAYQRMSTRKVPCTSRTSRCDSRNGRIPPSPLTALARAE
jgi:hypothetical protein